MDFICSFFKQPESGVKETKQHEESVPAKKKWALENPSLKALVVDSNGKEAEIRLVYGQKIRLAMWDDNLATQIFVKPGKEAGTYVKKDEVLRLKEDAPQLQCK